MNASRHGHSHHQHGEREYGRHGALPPGMLYTCTMHPEIRHVGPGVCFRCGMALEPVVESLEDPPDPEFTVPAESRYIPALGFRWLAPAYDVVLRTTTRERTFKSALIEQANFEPAREVLDLGCGTGTLAIWIKRRYPRVKITGIDGDPNILAIASRKAKEANVSIRLDRGLSFSLRYPDARFDRIVSSLFFHHLFWNDKQRTARELYRVMRPGGELHVADWGRSTGPLMRGAFLAIQLLDGFRNTQDNVEGKLVELFRDAGFTGVSQQRTFSTVFGTMALYRAVKRS